VRSLASGDIPGPAGLGLNADIGAIDSNDKHLDDDIGEVRSYVEIGHPLLDRSYLLEVLRD
jgi:hypothetical protein